MKRNKRLEVFKAILTKRAEAFADARIAEIIAGKGKSAVTAGCPDIGVRGSGPAEIKAGTRSGIGQEQPPITVIWDEGMYLDIPTPTVVATGKEDVAAKSMQGTARAGDNSAFEPFMHWTSVVGQRSVLSLTMKRMRPIVIIMPWADLAVQRKSDVPIFNYRVLCAVDLTEAVNCIRKDYAAMVDAGVFVKDAFARPANDAETALFFSDFDKMLVQNGFCPEKAEVA